MFKSIAQSGNESKGKALPAPRPRVQEEEKEHFSILAFMFMPQFKYSFRGGAHLYPVFIQMLAVMLVAADLLPRNHPGTRYGARDVEDISISDLMGEAWYNLRRQRKANMRAWGMFTSIVLMCFAFVGAMGALLARIFMGMGETAYAQIFTLQNNYLGLGPKVTGGTDLVAVAGAPAPPTVNGNLAMFDKRMGTNQNLPYDDWGLILLDKIVREAAAGSANGGQLQNALASILSVFNTAMTVVAAVMIFWIIVSVTADTAKTGVVGGGRHNMVWGPIRIVFGLGLMIPLSGGFSSGQYCVMKIAEWGSNLGTNGWTAYVNAVTGGGAMGGMVAGVVPGGSAGLVNDIAMMKVCQVAYNDYLYQSTGPAATSTPVAAGQTDPAQLVGEMNTWSGDGSKIEHNMTNATQKALCGGLTIAVPAGDAPGDTGWTGFVLGGSNQFGGWTAGNMMGPVPNRPTVSAAVAVFNYAQTIVEDGVLSLAAASAAASGGGYVAEGQTNCTNCSNPVAYTTSTAVGGLIYQVMMNNARANVAAGWISQIPVVECDTACGTPTAGNQSMNNFACSFVAHHAPGGTNGNGVAGATGTDNAQWAAITFSGNTYTNGVGGNLCPAIGSGATDCGGAAVAVPPALPSPQDDPDYSCHMNAIQAFQNSVNPMFGGTDGVTGTVVALLNTWLSGNLQTDMARYGWAAAGVYYTKLSSVNVAAQNMTQPAISFTPGVLTTVEATCDVELGTNDCAPSGIGYRVAQIMQAYKSWYDVNTQTGRGVGGGYGANAVAALNGGNGSNTNGAEFGADKPSNCGTMCVISLLWGGKTALNNAIAQQLGVPESRHPFMVNLVGSVSDNTLPLAHLSSIGAKLVIFGSIMMFATAIIQGVLGGINVGVSTTALGLSCMFTMIFSLCQVIVASGITLCFYVPLMPFIRSAFAVMTWMVSVFEAVVMIPIAALAHLTTEGDGLAAGARQCWVLWLNVLTRPILFVIGFIGAFIVYDAWVVYFTTAFAAASANAADQDNVIMKVLDYCFDSVFYVSTCYAAANSIFKMVDVIPSALMRWMPNGSLDTSFDEGAQASAQYASAASGAAASSMSSGASDLQSQISRSFSASRRNAVGRPGIGQGGQ
jgi:hypothetical protein